MGDAKNWKNRHPRASGDLKKLYKYKIPVLAGMTVNRKNVVPGRLIHRVIKYFCFLCLILLTIVLISCHREKKPEIKTIAVQEQPSTETLYYSGKVSPMSGTLISSPVDGVIDKRFFKYGSEIHKGQLLYTIKSLTQQSALKDALAEYLKTKQDAKNSEEQAKNSAELFKKGIVAKTEYKQDQNKYYVDNFAFIQAKRKLQEILTGYSIKLPPTISLSEINSVIKTLNVTEKLHIIKIYAPDSGIGLFHVQNSDGQGGGLHTGSQVKTGDTLLYLGDKAGISIKINVNEKNINHLFLQQKTLITSEIFPEINLTGYIETMDLQAATKNEQTGFLAIIVVPDVPPEQKKLIHVGMNVKVAITIYHKPKILIPVNAVFQQDGHSYVKILDPKNKKISIVPVTVGITTVDSIIINAGLNPGDQVVLPD